MSQHLCITVRFLDGTFHGRADRGESEWPPSPLRLFQALVAAAAAHWNERGHIEHAAPALRWLEAQPAPAIIAPRFEKGAKYRLYVPDNVGDLVAGRWSRGDDAAFIKKSEKDVRPTHLLDGEAVHYVWELLTVADDFLAQRETLFATAGSMTHLGWGVDMVAAHAATLTEPELAALPGQRWLSSPENADATPLRVPVAGTLADLDGKHTAFLNRMSGGRFSPVPPLSRFKLIGYADCAVPPPPPTAAFSLLQPDADSYRVFDPVRDGMRVAGMLRHAASQPALAAALGWDEEKMRRTVLGHAENLGEPHLPVDGSRIAFLPLPSLEKRPHGSEVVGGVRRVLLAGVRGQSREDLQDLARLLSGQELIAEEKPHSAVALLSRLPGSDSQVRRYVDKSSVWATVTPFILPGHDDRANYRARLYPKEGSGQPVPDSAQQREWLTKLDERTEALLRKAIRQAGYADELVCHAEISWRATGFCRGTALASEYAIPHKLRRFRRLHVRIVWRDAVGNPVSVPGPLCLGGGRFVGLGLFCGVSE